MSRPVLFIVVITVIIAIAAFLFVSFLTRSPELPGEPTALPPVDEPQAPTGQQYTVGGVVVFIPPGNRVQLAPVAPPPPTETPTVIEPSVTVIPQVPTNTPAPQQPAGAAANPGVDPIRYISYQVVAEDTLYRLTQKHNTSIELMASKGIDADDLVVGSVLERLPVANEAYCTSSRPYIVRPNDTVFSIARRFNTDKETIAAINSLGADYRIDIARVLCVP